MGLLLTKEWHFGYKKNSALKGNFLNMGFFSYLYYRPNFDQKFDFFTLMGKLDKSRPVGQKKSRPLYKKKGGRVTKTGIKNAQNRLVFV